MRSQSNCSLFHFFFNCYYFTHGHSYSELHRSHRNTEYTETTHRIQSRLHPRAQTHRINFTPLTSCPPVARQHLPRPNSYNHLPLKHLRKTPLIQKHYQDQEPHHKNRPVNSSTNNKPPSLDPWQNQ